MAQPSDKKPRRQEPAARVSVSFPGDDYIALKAEAAAKRVSVAWVVRDAVYAYLRRRTGRTASSR